MNRTQLNLALGIVVLALGIGVWFSQEKKEVGPPLTPLKPDEITRISIEHPQAPAIRLEKADGKWRLVEPVRGLVDNFEVNSLVSLAEVETKETLDRAAVKLGELLLDPPQYDIQLNDTRIGFGSVEPLNYRRYVKVGEAVYLIEDPPSAALDKDWADLVGKTPVPEGAEIVKLEVPGLTIARGPDGNWQASPPNPKATPESIQKVLDGWKSARSMWNELAAGAAGNVKGDAVRITLKDGAVNLVVAERDPQFKLYSPDLQVRYVLPKSLIEQLLQLPEPKPEAPPEGAADPAAEAPDAPE